MEHIKVSKKWDIINDMTLILAGIALFVLKTFYSIHFVTNTLTIVTGVFFAVIGIIGFFVDMKIVEKQREKAVWWQLNLPVILGVLLINSGTFYADINPSGHDPSNIYLIISVSISIALWILAFGYDIWRKYRRYLKHN